MRLAHLSDLHLTEGPRLADHAATLDRVLDEAVAARPDAWLVTGDLCGRTVPHRSTPAERAVLFPALVRMAGLGPVVVVAGNHDHGVDVAGLAHLGGDFPIRVATRAEVFDLPTPGGRLEVYALPYPSKGWVLADEVIPAGVEAIRAAVEARLALLLRLWAARIRTSTADARVFSAHVQVRGARTSGGEILAGQEQEITTGQLVELGADYCALGHLHLRQEVAPRAWYVGSPWRVDHGEREPEKSWNLVEIRGRDARVIPVPTGCRNMVTLDYRWATAEEGQDEAVDGTRPRWVRRPIDAALAAVRGAEVRARLVVPAQWVAGCPWDRELARLAEAGAWRVVPERRIEPVLRVRAPEVASAVGTPDKLGAYWRTLATQPEPGEAAAALAALAELQAGEDEGVHAAIRELAKV